MLSTLAWMASRNIKNIEPPITIAEAAKLLGVSQPTLRRWDELGKFKARRHPINGYRLYDRAMVLKLRDKIMRGRAA
jgi:excisionase family DNA binding protein